MGAAREENFSATILREIEGDRALAHKKFDGKVALSDGGFDILNWQSVYTLARLEGNWKLTGFVGYLPYPMGGIVSG